MPQLFRLLNKAKYFILFFLLELLCFFLIKRNNLKWNVSYFNSSRAIAGGLMSKTEEAKAYIRLDKINDDLAKENSYLRSKLGQIVSHEGLSKTDSTYAQRLDYQLARVVNSSIGQLKNYITINKGTLDGIEPGMGVIGPKGIVGQVKSCSDHFSVVYSVLHQDLKISSEIKSKKLDQVALGLSTWDGRSHKYVKLNTIDKFKPVAVGDTVVTSAQNLVFPPDILVGRVVKLVTPANGAFHDITVKLSSDMNGLTYVYVVKNRLYNEQKGLEEEAMEQ